MSHVYFQARLAWINKIGGQVPRAVFPVSGFVRQVVLNQTKGPENVRLRVSVWELQDSQAGGLPTGYPLGRGREAGREVDFAHDREPPGS